MRHLLTIWVVLRQVNVALALVQASGTTNWHNQLAQPTGGSLLNHGSKHLIFNVPWVSLVCLGPRESIARLSSTCLTQTSSEDEKSSVSLICFPLLCHFAGFKNPTNHNQLHSRSARQFSPSLWARNLSWGVPQQLQISMWHAHFMDCGSTCTKSTMTHYSKTCAEMTPRHKCIGNHLRFAHETFFDHLGYFAPG